MMQLLCNGTFLDLYEGSGLQFTHKNPLFAFDALECERTTSFKIPATPKNDRVLALAKLPALSGVAMRRKYDAELYEGTVVKRGYIYVSNFDGKDYNAIFVTGELVGLQALKNAGKIRDLLVFDQAVTWDNTTTHTADEATLPNVGFVQYERDPSAAHLNASISLRWLMEQIATKTGATINYLNAQGDERWRLLAAGADIYNLNDLAVRLANRGTEQDPIFLQTLLGITIGYSAGAYIADCVAVPDEQNLRWASQQPTLQQFEMLKFAYEIALEFPDDFPDDYFIMSNGYWSMSGDTWHNEEICNMYYSQGDGYYVFGPYGRCANFLGDYSFDWNGTVHGAPLAGRKVTIPANTPFALLPKSALVFRVPEDVGDTATIGYDTSAVPAYDYEVRISINHDFVYGEDVPLNAMLPEFTAVELLKLYAAINGCVLNYTDAQGVTFEPLDFDNYPIRSIKALTKRGELVRTFSDYAQQNIVKMTPEDWVWLGERIKTQYAIDNDNIEAEKDLLMLKASEGGKKIAYTNDSEVHTRLLVRNDAEGKRKAKDQTIALASVDDPYMLRVTIPTIEGLQNLCTVSTQQKISARMTLLEYNAIQAKTLALVDGLRYIWTERSWQKNEAQFTLARLYERGAAPVPTHDWLTNQTKETLITNFGQTDGQAIIDATNAYLDSLAVEYATRLAGFINQDPMLVCSIDIEPSGVSMPIRWLVGGGDSYIDTGHTPTNSVKIHTLFSVVEAYNSVVYGSAISYSSNSFECYSWGNIQVNYGSETLWIQNADGSNEVWSDANVFRYKENNVQEQTFNFPLYSGTFPYSLYLFATHRPTLFTQNKSRIAFFIMEDANNYKARLVPCTSLNGMLDLETLTLFPNQSTGAFTEYYTEADRLTPWTPGS